MQNRVRIGLSYLLWPALFGGAVAINAAGIAAGYGVGAFLIAYPLLALAIGLLERTMPHERAWLEPDGQTFANLAHTALTKGAAFVVITVFATVGLAEIAAQEGGGAFWPGAWPFWAQVVLALAIAEFGLYWAHRIAHEWPLLWRFHAVHHSVTRLWFVNTGRFHFVDTIASILLSQPLLYLAGAPTEVFQWVAAVTAFIGILTHCNIEMRFGPVSWVFNTPGLHRWHHSMVLEEGNTNYGENLMLWDQLFGTFYNPNRRPPAEIGIEGPMPAAFLAQLAHPFRRQEVRDAPPREEAPLGGGA